MTIEQLTAIRAMIAAGLTDTVICAAFIGSNAPAKVQPRENGNGGNNGDSDESQPRRRENAVTYRALVTVDRLGRINLTPQQRRVAEYVIANPGKTSAEIAAATGIQPKAVQSPIYQLRKTNPRVLRSSQD